LLNQIRDALTMELSDGSLPPISLGDTPYADLLSSAALERSRLWAQSVLIRPPTRAWSPWNLVLPPLTSQTDAISRLTRMAAVYQHLGLALQANGRGVEAQRAFAFADEIAAMRPKVSQ
jgi:hypothetical protein